MNLLKRLKKQFYKGGDMEVSKLTIGQETISKLNRMAHISGKERSNIKKSAVKRFIKENSSKEITIGELMQAAGYIFTSTTDKKYKAGSFFIGKMLRDGHIVKNNPKARKSTYSLPGDIQVVKNVISEPPVEVKEEDLNVPKEEVVDKKEIFKEFENKYSFQIRVGENGKTYSQDIVTISFSSMDVESAKRIIIETLDSLDK